MRGKKVLKNIIISLILQIVVAICGFIAPRLIIQNYGSNVNGLISSIAQFLAYITLLEAGIGPVVKAVLYKPIANKDNKQIANILKASEKFFKTISYIFIVYIIVLCIAFPIITSNQFNAWYTISLVLIISISTFAEYYFGMTYRLYLQAEQQTYITSGIQIISTILNTIAIVVLIKLGANIQIVKLASAVIFVLRPILQNIYVKKKYSINFKDADNNYKLEQKWDGLAQHIAAVIHSNTDVAMLTFFSTLKEVSVYSVYMLVYNGIKNLVQAFTNGIDASFGDMIAKGEKEKLKENFSTYEFIYYTVITIIIACTTILVNPFIKIYTSDITDTSYIRPIFVYVITSAYFALFIRMLYSSITLAAGHFKETKKGAWVEAIINIGISVILVFKFGIVGVAIGTLIATTIRMIEFIYHTSKYITQIPIIDSAKKLILSMIEIILIVILSTKIEIPFENAQNYIQWIIYAIEVLMVTGVSVTLLNILLNKKDFKTFINKCKNIIRK